MWSCDGLPPLLVLGGLENGGDGGKNYGREGEGKAEISARRRGNSVKNQRGGGRRSVWLSLSCDLV